MNAKPAPTRICYPDAVLLCVDDDPSSLDLRKAILERNGYGVLTAREGKEALRVFRQNKVDLVLVDYQMQGMNGDELACEIKGLNPHTPVIMHSGEPALPHAALQAADACIPKGSEPYQLIAAISALIMKSRLRADGLTSGSRDRWSPPH